jgi:hypothetical protein
MRGAARSASGLSRALAAIEQRLSPALTGRMPTDETQRSPLARLQIRFLSAASLHDDWLVAETEASLALAAWRAARPGAKARAHAAYVAALSREAHAADLLAARVSPA